MDDGTLYEISRQINKLGKELMEHPFTSLEEKTKRELISVTLRLICYQMGSEVNNPKDEYITDNIVKIIEENEEFNFSNEELRADFNGANCIIAYLHEVLGRYGIEA